MLLHRWTPSQLFERNKATLNPDFLYFEATTEDNYEEVAVPKALNYL